MSQMTEIRFDVSELFYPDDLTAAGETPLSTSDIRSAFEQKVQELFPGNTDDFVLVESMVDDDFATLEICSTDMDETTIAKAAVATAKGFYPEIERFDQDYNVVESDIMVRELRLDFIEATAEESTDAED